MATGMAHRMAPTMQSFCPGCEVFVDREYATRERIGSILTSNNVSFVLMSGKIKLTVRRAGYNNRPIGNYDHPIESIGCNGSDKGLIGGRLPWGLWGNRLMKWPLGGS